MLKTISVKTQVRRLKYFSKALNFIGKKGIPKSILETRLIKWSEENHDDFEAYLYSSGELTKKKINSPSFLNYYEALIRIDLINEQSGLVLLSKTGAVFYEAFKLFDTSDNTNVYSLNSLESFFYLNCILSKDTDLLLTVISQLYNFKEMTIGYYQENFKSNYLERLINKKDLPFSYNEKVELSDVISRVSGWKSPKRYSEDIVPPRINWMADIGIVELKDTNVFTFTDVGSVIANELLNDDHLFNDSDNWISNNFCSVFSKAFIKIPTRKWSHIEEIEREKLIGEGIDLSLRAFKVLGLSRLSVNQCFLFIQIYLLFKYKLIAEINDIGDWIGFEKFIGDKKIGLRKSARSYESYIIVAYAQ
ncbi:hypothetical protein D9M68_463430 [compost metagenome]